MDIEKTKTKRTTVRTLFSKLATKIENTIGCTLSTTFTIENKIDELHSLKNQLLDKIKDLNTLDEEIEGVIDVKELEKELINNDKYKETGIILKTKIDRCIVSLEKQLNPLKRKEPLHNVESNDTNESRVKNENSFIKLPRINISTFNGDCSDWLDFWNSYEVAIHKNDSLSNIEKFAYLKTYLKGTALTAVSGFAITEQNYDSCISLLKERFGRTDLIISCHMNKLLLVDSVKSVHNVTALRKMYDAIEIQVRSLESLGVAAGTYSSLLSPIILQKIPEELNLLYNRQRKSKELFDIKDLIEFLRQEIECRETSLLLGNQRNNVTETLIHKPVNNYNYSKPKYPQSPKRNVPTASALISTVENRNCIFCSKSHMTHNCTLNASERKKSLLSQGRCFSCLGRRHTFKNCWKRNKQLCNCGQTHNPLICEYGKPKQSSNPEKIPSETITSSENSLSLFCNESKIEKNNSDFVYLQTLTVATRSGQELVHLHCLIDGGATRSFIRRDIVESLGLPVLGKETLLIYAFGNEVSKKQAYDVVEIELQNVSEAKKKIKIKAIVIDCITKGQIQVPSTWVRELALQRQIKLADTGYSAEIHLLIGSDYVWDILQKRNVRLSKRLVATDSIFGFVIQGQEGESNCRKVHVSHLSVSRGEINDQVKCLWDLEAIGISEPAVSQSDTEILETFEQNIKYKNGRYETRLLWRQDYGELSNNYDVAKRRLFSLNNTFRRNENLYLRYKDILKEQLNDDIIEEVKPNSGNKSEGYFMPHHGVVRESKETTKVRICYDASSKAKNELSLNECLDSGPNLNPDLLKIILRFRYHPIAFCADIQRAFLEISITEDDRKFLQFLWGNENGTDLDLNDGRIRVLRMKRVPFGVKCSPFLLAATIRFHVKGYEKEHERACGVLRDLYVDDLINGAETVDEAAFISSDATQIMKEASMNLRQWVTNSTELREIWNSQKFECRQTSIERDVPLKVLGLVWDNDKDILKVALNTFHQTGGTPTKRMVLSVCGMIFDPLGLLTPFTVRIKLMMQELWEKGVSWDEPLPSDFNGRFEEWTSEVSYIQNITIPRQYFEEVISELELHLFSDASPKMYGAVAYFRMKCADTVKTSFVIAKSRLAPLKEISLPRLELLGTLVAARLCSYLAKTFPMIKENNIFLWTDSNICLHWIKGFAKDWKPFVKNRVCEIKEKTNPMSWHHCSGKTNPADKLTRGMSIHKLINDKAWISGPSWLLKDDILTSNVTEEFDLEEVEVEKRKIPVLLQICQESTEPLIDLNKFNNLRKVLRITAYILRFVNNCKSNKLNLEKRSGILSTEELMNAEKYWVHVTQQLEFKREYCQLKGQTPISPESKLFSLNPSLNADGLICLGGRLQNSGFQFYEKHPMILPFKSKFTDLVIMNEHENMFHSGVSDTLTQLRERYWIIRGRQAVKTRLNKCFVCRRYKAKKGNQVTAPLPIDRIHEGNPFEVTGVDFAGPLYTKDKDKVYIALFTCAVTRALHLEAVTSMNTHDFLLAFRRFISRRGICRIVQSDNAKTFKRAEFELKTLYSNLEKESVQEFFGTKGIKWKYIAERAAWWGGYWERMVKMTKAILRKILGRALLNFEELLTILAETESILNSRPITYVYNEPDEPFPLSPSNFLTGKRSTALPHWAGSSKLNDLNKQSLIKRFFYREKLLNAFWKRWKGEYLLQLKSCNFINPMIPKVEFNINDVVLIGDDKAPRQMWKLGRVIQIHKGRDQKVRSVTLQTPSGQIKRPIQLLYHLELR